MNTKFNKSFAITLLLPLIMLMLFSGTSHGLVMARAAMTVDDLRFSSTDPLAEIFWFEEIPGVAETGWRGEVHAQAQDSLSGIDADSAEIFGDNVRIAVDANTALVESLAEYGVSNGPEVAKGGGEIEIITGTGLEINNIEAQASGEAGGNFDNFFVVSGGDPGGPVPVTFELDYTYLLDAAADAQGFFDVFVFALLEIADFDDIPGPSGDADTVDDFADAFVLRTESGTNTSIFELVSDTLIINAVLEFDKEYFLFAEADSEVFGTNTVPVPEPQPLPLALLGLSLLAVTRHRVSAARASISANEDASSNRSTTLAKRRPKLVPIVLLIVINVIFLGHASAKPIGGDSRSCGCSDIITPDNPPGTGPSRLKDGGSFISVSEAMLGDVYPVFNAAAANGAGLDFALHYSSDTADGEKAVINTGMGYGWNHSYGAFLFKQGRDIFKQSPSGKTTKYGRSGRRSGPLQATRGHQQSITENSDGSIEIRNNDGLTFRFEKIPDNPIRVAGAAPWMLVSMTDRNALPTRLVYTDGLLDRVEGPYGRQIKFAYDAQNRLIQVMDPAGRVTQLGYEGTQNLAAITDPLGQTTHYQYNVRHQLVKKIDRDGRAFSYQYDGENHPIAILDANGDLRFKLSNSTGWATDISELFRDKQRLYVPSTTTLTDGRGNQWRYDYDSNGFISQMTAPDGAITAYSYDPITANVAAETDANGHATTFEYEAKGNLIKRIDPLGHITRYEYEPVFNMRTKMTDANGRVSRYEYDAFGNRIEETNPLGGERKWTYDANGNVLTEEDENGHVTSHEYDALGNRVKTTDAENNVVMTEYDIMGNTLARTDANGHAARFAYDALDRLTKETDAADKITLTSYDGEGNRTAVTDRNGHTTRFEYDVRHRLIKMTDALDSSETYAYDGNDNRIVLSDKNEHTTRFEYDVQNRLINTVDAENFTTSRSYDGVGNVLKQIDANNHATEMDYDALNRLIKTIDAEGNIAQTAYDMVGLAGCSECTGPTKGSSLVTRQIDGEGKLTYLKYDGLDRQIIQVRKENDIVDSIDTSDAVTRWSYDAVSNRLTMTEPNGNTMTWDYDDIDRVIKETNAAGDRTLTSYDGAGNVKTVTAPNGNVTANTYDALNRLVQVDDSVGRVANFSYDPEGNRLTERDGNGNGGDFKYDAIYRVEKVTDALGEMTAYSYDRVGNLLVVTDREGNVTTHEYDDINRRVKSTDEIDAMTRFEYDGAGNLIKITDANGHATDYEYDKINRLIKETYADGGVREFTYDRVNNLLAGTDQKGRTTQYVYNDLHFLIQRDYPVSADDEFSYDLSGRMLTAERDAWLVTFEYDGANRVIETGQNGKTVLYDYDIPGRTRLVTYPGGREVLERTDFRERLSTINDPLNILIFPAPPPIAEYRYDPGNRALTRTYRNGVTAGYSYNANNWITRLDHTAGGNRIAGFAHEYDKEGNKRFEDRLHQPVRSEAYQYDDIYRLIDYKVGDLVGSSVPIPATQTEYNLDLVGNWDEKITDGTVETRDHGPTNEITRIDTVDIFHDDNGNTEEDERYTYEYDEENRLTRVTRKTDGQVVGQYQYDALGRRVVKISDPFLASAPVETHYFYDDARVIEEQDAAMTTLATYVYGNYIDEVLTMDHAGADFYYHQNTLWSVAAITDSTANVVEQYAYDAYGLVMVSDGFGVAVADNPWATPHSAIGNPYLFTGRRLDEETGLYYYRARYFDSEKGRFLQRDPLGFVDGTNLYEYVKSNPIAMADAFGLIAGLGKYKCCDTKNTNKTKTVEVGQLILHGSAGDAKDIPRANEIYEQCCIKIKSCAKTTWGERLSRAAIGNDLLVEEFTDPTRPTTEEEELLKFRHNCGINTVMAYWVKGFSPPPGSRGEAFWTTSIGAGKESAIMANSRAQDTFAHELGHVLLNDGGHNDTDKNNLMASGRIRDSSGKAGTDKLSESECDKIRKSKFVQ